MRLRISDLFDDAPACVLEALAVILLSRLYSRKVDPRFQRVYRQYTLSPRMRERSQVARKSRGRPRHRSGPKGRVYDLGALFSELNAKYFGSGLRRPALSWTHRPSRSVLGSYEFDEDLISISRDLDSTRVPGYVIRYILFHEMLHVKHGTRIEGTREIVHPPAFRMDEKRFSHYYEASLWLENH